MIILAPSSMLHRTCSLACLLDWSHHHHRREKSDREREKPSHLVLLAQNDSKSIKCMLAPVRRGKLSERQANEGKRNRKIAAWW